MKLVIHELQMWLQFIVKNIPGRIGCAVRNFLYPYQCGKNVTIWDGVQIDKPSKLKIGNNVSINRGAIINAEGGITIGDDVLIAPNVIIYSQNHIFESTDLIRKSGYKKSPVIINDNVWIASGCMIMPGITIGSGCVIGAGSIVTRNVPENCLAVGNPAKIIKELKQQ